MTAGDLFAHPIRLHLALRLLRGCNPNWTLENRNLAGVGSAFGKPTKH